jgi:molybdopterin-guanine dinucleotide biosynthesis adapter protein
MLYYRVHLQEGTGECMPKFVAVVGGKHAGKTTVIQNLIPELKKRGYRVGAIKEMVRIPTLDTPATETDRYREAGAEIVVALPRNETVVFIDRRMSLKEIAPFIQGLDFVLLEGFETEKNLPKIIAAKTAKEAASYNDESAIAVSGLIFESADETEKVKHLRLPMCSGSTDAGKLADIVEMKASSKF